MKTLMKIIPAALVAISLSACGNNNAAQLAAQQAALAASQQYGSGSSCISQGVQTMSVSFSDSNATLYQNAVLVAGNLPGGAPHPGQYGQMVVGGGVAGAGTGGTSVQFSPKNSASGMMQLYMTGTALSGTLTFTQPVVTALLQASGSYYNTYNPAYPNYNTQNICITSIGIDAAVSVSTYNNYNTGYTTGYGTSTGTVIQALVYVTLSNGQSFGPIPYY